MVNPIPRCSNCLISIDQFLERIPFASTVSTIFKIFMRCILGSIRPEIVLNNHYYSYITNQSRVRLFFLLIPVLGNVIVWLSDRSCKSKESDSEQKPKISEG